MSSTWLASMIQLALETAHPTRHVVEACHQNEGLHEPEPSIRHWCHLCWNVVDRPQIEMQTIISLALSLLERAGASYLI